MSGFAYAIETSGLIRPTPAADRVEAVSLAHAIADAYNRPANIYIMPKHHLYGVVYPSDSEG